MNRAIGRHPRTTTITTHELAFRWCSRCGSSRRAFSSGVQRVDYLANQLKVRADTGIDENERKAQQCGDQQVLQSASSFVAGSVVAACAEVRRIGRTPARYRVSGAAARLRFLRSSIETAGRQTTPVNRFFEDARDFLRESAMFGSSASAQRLLQVIRNVSTDKNAFSISHLSSPSLGPSGLPCKFGTGL